MTDPKPLATGRLGRFASLARAGLGTAVSMAVGSASGVERVSSGVDRLVQAGFDRLGPVRRAREEMARLKSRLEELEASLDRIEGAEPVEPAATAARPRRTVRRKQPA